MKNHPHRPQSGFTLVELLVVIAIIAVLASAGFAAGNAAIQKARKTTALATAVALETAVNNFYTEYSTLPKEGITGDTVINTRTDLAVLRELLGLGSNLTLNTRSIKFLSVREGRANRNGLMYNTSGTDITGLFDPWGGPYFMMLDGDFDEKVNPQPAGGGGRVLSGRRVAAWSNGADAAPSGTGGKSGDNVITW